MRTIWPIKGTADPLELKYSMIKTFKTSATWCVTSLVPKKSPAMSTRPINLPIMVARHCAKLHLCLFTTLAWRRQFGEFFFWSSVWTKKVDSFWIAFFLMICKIVLQNLYKFCKSLGKWNIFLSKVRQFMSFLLIFIIENK